jgi:hypothetical protein
MQKFFYKKHKSNGAAAILTVIIIGVAALIVGYNSSFLAIEEAQVGYQFQLGMSSLNLTEACAEEALERLRRDGAYSGGTLSILSGSCIITVISSPPQHNILVSGNLGGYMHEIAITVTANSNYLTINSWIDN